MARARDESRWTLVVFMLLASLLVHLVLWPVGEEIIALGWDAPPLPRSEGWMQVALVDKDEAPPPEPEKEADRRKETDPPGRLIKQDRVQKEQRPDDDTKYVSEFDQKVEKESRAPNQRPRPGGAPVLPGDSPDADGKPMTRPTPQQATPAPVPTPGPANEGDGDQREGAQADRAPEGPLPLAPGRVTPSGRPGLRGTPGTMERAIGGAGSFDKIDDDVAEGNETILNSRRWKYASFFNRVRDAVAERWHPDQIHAVHDPTGQKFGTIPRVTRLYIKLNPDGSVNKILVESPSGLEFLDEEAIRAVREAQPFNNPPPQLVDPESGLIEFGFGFRLEFDKHGGRIFRYQR